MLQPITAYKDFLRIQGDTLDESLTELAKGVEQRVKSFLKRDVLQQEYTEVFDGDGTSYYFPKQYPIISITKIERYDPDTELYVEMTSDEIGRVVHTATTIRFVDFVTEVGTANYKITYTAGYKETEIPSDITLACKRLFQLYYGNSAFGEALEGVSARSKEVGGNAIENINVDAEAEAKILRSIAMYRAVNV